MKADYEADDEADDELDYVQTTRSRRVGSGLTWHQYNEVAEREL